MKLPVINIFVLFLIVFAFHLDAQAQQALVCNSVAGLPNEIPDIEANQCAPRLARSFVVRFTVRGDWYGPVGRIGTLDTFNPARPTERQTVQVRFNWDSENRAPGLPAAVEDVPAKITRVTAATGGNLGETLFEATASRFIYPEDLPACRMAYEMSLVIDSAVVACQQPATGEINVWNTLANQNQGVHAITHDRATAGTQVSANSVEICRLDDTAIRFLDGSNFNCGTAFVNDIANRNREARWVQWVYGTNNTVAGQDPNAQFFIENVPYTRDQLPVFGEVQYLQADVDAPNSNTLNIQMPNVGAMGGERFGVTLRSWNICNPFDQFLLDGDGLNPQPIQGMPAFDPFQGAAVHQTAAAQQGLIANGIPVETEFFIDLIDLPAQPTAVDNRVCLNDAIAGINFQVNGITNSTRIEWFTRDAVGNFNLLNNPLGLNSSTFRAQNLNSFNTNAANVHELWVSYSQGNGPNACESIPIRTTVTVVEQLPMPVLATPNLTNNMFETCIDDGRLMLNLQDLPADQNFGGPNDYDWRVTNADVQFVQAGQLANNGQGQTVTIDFSALAIVGNFLDFQVSVQRIYDFNNNTCRSQQLQFTVRVYSASLGGTLTNNNIAICEGVQFNTTLQNSRGDVLNWSESLDAGATWNIIAGSANQNQILRQPNNAGQLILRANVKNGSCPAIDSRTSTIQVNPIPPMPILVDNGSDGTVALNANNNNFLTVAVCDDGVNAVRLRDNAVAVGSQRYFWFSGNNFMNNGAIDRNASFAQGDGMSQIEIRDANREGNIRLAVQGPNNTQCLSPISDPVDIYFNQLPEIRLVGGGAVCNGVAAPIVAVEYSGFGGYELWYDLANNMIAPNNIALPNDLNQQGAVIGGNNNALQTDIRWDIQNSNVLEAGENSREFTLMRFRSNYGAFPNTRGLQSCEADNTSPAFTNNVTVITRNTDSPSLDNTVPASFFVAAPICHSNNNVVMPNIIIDLMPDQSITYNVEFSVTGPNNFNQMFEVTQLQSNPNGVLTIVENQDYNYAFFNNTPGDYTITIESIISALGCAADLGNPLPNTTLSIFGFPPDPVAVQNPDFGGCDNPQASGQIEVMDPGNGLSVRWYTNNNLNTPATGVLAPIGNATGGDAFRFTPTQNTETDYFAVTTQENRYNNQLGVQQMLECTSENSLAVKHQLDINTTPADADADDDDQFLVTCTDALTLGAMGVDRGGNGAWTVVNGSNNITFDDATVPNTTVRNLSVGRATLRWTANSSLGFCAPTTQDVVVERFALPTLRNAVDDLCEDAFGTNEVAGVDLSDYRDDVIPLGAVVTNYNYEYFTDAQLANQIGNPNNFDVQPANGTNTVTLHVRVTDTNSSGFVTGQCSSNATIRLTVNSLPNVSNIISPHFGSIPPMGSTQTAEAFFCEEDINSADKDEVNLEIFHDDIVRPSLATGFNFSWFRQRKSVVQAATAIQRSTVNGVQGTYLDNVTDGDVFWSVVTDANTGCQSEASVTINIGSRPQNNEIIDLAPGTVGQTYTTNRDVNNAIIAVNQIQLCASAANVLISVNDRINTNVNYIWQINAPNGEIAPLNAPITANNLSSLPIQILNPTGAAGAVRITVREEFQTTGCSNYDSGLDIIVNDNPSPPNIEGTTDVCVGALTNLRVVNPIPNATYNWILGNLGTITNPVGPGQPQNDINLRVADAAPGGDVALSVVSNDCRAQVDAQFPLIIHPLPEVTFNVPGAANNQVPNILTICSGEQISNHVQFDDPINANAQYVWTVTQISNGVQGANLNAGGIVDANGLLNTVLQNTQNTVGTITYRINPTNEIIAAGNPGGPASCLGMSVDLIINVEPVPNLAATTNQIAYCSGERFNISLISNTQPNMPTNLGYVLNVTSNQATAIQITNNLTYPNGNPSQGFTNGADNIVVLYNNNDNNDVTLNFSFTPTLTGCANGNPVVLPVVITPSNPLFNVNTTPANNKTFYCSDEQIEFNLTPTAITNSNLTYSVAASVALPATTNDILGWQSLNQTIITNQDFNDNFTRTLRNVSDDPITVTFQFFSQVNGCTNNNAGIDYDIILQPVPNLDFGPPQTTTVCNQNQINIPVTDNITPSTEYSSTYAVSFDNNTNNPNNVQEMTAPPVQNTNARTYGQLRTTLQNITNQDLDVTFRVTPELLRAAATPAATVSDCANGLTETQTITIEPTPSLTATHDVQGRGANQNIYCHQQEISFTVLNQTISSNTNNLQYDVAVTPINNTNNTDFNIINENYQDQNNNFGVTRRASVQNLTNQAIDVRFTFTPTLLNCPNGQPVDVDVVIDPPASLTAVNNNAPTNVICSGDAIDITVRNQSMVAQNGGAVTYSLDIVSTRGAKADIRFAGGANPEGNNLPFTNNMANITPRLTNISNRAIDLDFRFTPQIGGTCAAGPVQIISLTVEPTPVITATFQNGISDNDVICSDLEINIDVAESSTTNGIVVYQVNVQTLPMNVAITDNTGADITFPLANQALTDDFVARITNSNTTSQPIIFEFVPTLGNCNLGATVRRTVIVDPIPDLSVTNNATILCNNTPLDINLTSEADPNTGNGAAFITTIAAVAGANLNAVTGIRQLQNNTIAYNGAGVGSEITAMLVNTTDDPITLTFTFTPIFQHCNPANAGAAKTTQVTVEPTPSLLNPTFTAGSNRFCSGDLVEFTVQSNTTTSNSKTSRYKVKFTSPADLTKIDGEENIINQFFDYTMNNGQTFTNNTNNPVEVIMELIPVLIDNNTGTEICSEGNKEVLTFNLEATPDLTTTLVTPNIICNDGNVRINVSKNTNPVNNFNLSYDANIISLTGTVTDIQLSNNDLRMYNNQSYVVGRGLDVDVKNNTLNTLTTQFDFTPNLDNCASGTSRSVDIMVEPKPELTVSEPAQQSLCYDSDITFTATNLTTTNSAAGYQVTINVNGGGSNFDYSTSNSPSIATRIDYTNDFLLQNLQNKTDNTLQLEVIFTPLLDNCPSGDTVTKIINLEPKPRLTVQRNNGGTLCNDEKLSFQLSNPLSTTSSGNFTYDVSVSNSTDITFTGGTTTTQGGMNTTIFNTLNYGSFEITPNNSSNMPLDISLSFTPRFGACLAGDVVTQVVEIQPTPTITAQFWDKTNDMPIGGANQIICDQTDVLIRLTRTSTTTVAQDLGYELNFTEAQGKSLDNIIGIKTLNSHTVFNSFDADAFKEIDLRFRNNYSEFRTIEFEFTPSIQNCNNTVTSSSLILTIQPEPSLEVAHSVGSANHKNSNVVCSGDKVEFDLSHTSTHPPGTQVGYNSSYKVIPNSLFGNVTLTNLNNMVFPGGTSQFPTGGASVPSADITNASSEKVTVEFTFEPVIGSCTSGPPKTISVVVEPQIEMMATLNSSSEICSGEELSVSLSTPKKYNNEIRYSLSPSRPSGGNNIDLNEFTQLNTNYSNLKLPAEIRLDLNNSSNSTYDLQLAFTPSHDFCTNGPIITEDILIDPIPSLSASLATPPQNNNYCDEQTVIIDLVSQSTTTIGSSNFTYDLNISYSGNDLNNDFTGLSTLIANNNMYPTNNNNQITIPNLKNNTSERKELIFEFTPKLNNCDDGRVVSVSFTVEPTPELSAILSTANKICSGGSSIIKLSSQSSSTSNLTYGLDITGIPPTLPPASTIVPTKLSDIQRLPTSPSSDNIYNNMTLNGLQNSGKTYFELNFEFTPELASCTSGTPENVTLIIEPVPELIVRLNNNNNVICSGDGINIDIESAVISSVMNDLTYKVEIEATSGDISNLSGSGYTNQQGAAYPYPGMIDGDLINRGDSEIEVKYTFTPQLNSCTNGTPVTQTITVLPVPKLSYNFEGVTKNIMCEGENITVNVTSPTTTTNATLSYRVDVTSDDLANSGGGAFASSTNNIGTKIQGILENRSAKPITYTFELTPILNGHGCADGPKEKFDIVVRPTPEVSLSTTTADLCGQGDVNIVLTSQTTTVMNENVTFDISVTSSDQNSTSGQGFQEFLTAKNVTLPYTIQGEVNNNSPQGSDITLTYTVTPRIDNCTSTGTIQQQQINLVFVPIISQNNDKTVCSDEPLDLEILLEPANSPSTTVFNWPSPVLSDVSNQGTAGNNISTGMAGDIHINDAINNTSSKIISATYSIAASYQNCNARPVDVKIDVLPEPVLDMALSTKTVCSGEPIDVVFNTNGTSVNASTYDVRVQNSNNLVAGSNNATQGNNKTSTHIKDDIWINKTNAAIDVVYTITPYAAVAGGLQACEGDPMDITVTITPEPVIDPILTSHTVCSGLGLGLTLSQETSSVVPTNYKVIRVAPETGLIGLSVTSQGIGGADIITSDIWINENRNSLNVVYTILALNGNCEGEEFDITVTIYSAPKLVNMDKVVCSNSELAIVMGNEASSPAASSYELTSVVMPNNLTLISQQPSNTTFTDANFIFTDKYTNSTPNPLDVVYTIVPIEPANNCRGLETNVTITIEPEPDMHGLTPETICSGDDTNITLNSSVNPSAGDITYDVMAIPNGPISGFSASRTNLPKGHVIQDELRNLSNDEGSVTYTVTPRIFGTTPGNGCLSPNPKSVIITVEPEPTGYFDQRFVSVCEGVSLDGLDNFIKSTTNSSQGSSVSFELSNVISSNNALSGYTTSGVYASPNNEIKDVINIADNLGIKEAQTLTYQLTPRIEKPNGSICNGDARSVELDVTVRPRPVLTPSYTEVELCSTESFSIDLTNDLEPGTAISSWVVADNPLVDGEYSGTGNVMFLNLVNNSPVVQTLEYTVTPQSIYDANCGGDPQKIIVHVNPVPDVIVDNNEITACSGDKVNIPLNGSVKDTRFEWEATVMVGNNVSFGAPGTSATQGYTNGGFIDHTVTNNGTNTAIVRYKIKAVYDKSKNLNTGVDFCDGYISGFVNVLVSPEVTAKIEPHPQDGNSDRYRCDGDSEPVNFTFTGAPPFKLVLDVTDENGLVGRQLHENLPQNYTMSVEKTSKLSIVEVVDNGGCSVFSNESVNIVYERAVADFTINGTTSPSSLTLDYNTGTVVVDVDFNEFDDSNIYTLRLGNKTLSDSEITKNFKYTFTEPSDVGTLGHLISLEATSPTAFNCNSVLSFYLEVLPSKPSVIAEADVTEGCPPFVVNFEGYREDLSLSKNVKTENLIWTIDGQLFNTPNPQYTFTKPGVYDVELRGDNGHGLEDYANIIIKAYDVPEVSFIVTQDAIYIPDEGFTPVNKSTGVTEYLWDFGDFNTSIQRSPLHYYAQEGEYEVMLKGFNEDGCEDVDTNTIIVEEGGLTKTPNAFTPSLDGPSGGIEIDPMSLGNDNDIFLPISTGVLEFNMWIYDRWGKLIFYSNNSKMGWDGYDSNGRLLPSGVYVYKLDLIFSSGERSTRVGDITLIR